MNLRKKEWALSKESLKGMFIFLFNLIFILMFFCYLCMLNTSMKLVVSIEILYFIKFLYI